MERHVIRTGSTDSVRGIPSRQNIDVRLTQTSKNLPFPNVSYTLNQRSVYEKERQSGNKFRLILTVVPYCTNVLFNALTEIIKDEGDSGQTVITDLTNHDGNKNVTINEAYGTATPTRAHMISNTEYSSPKHGGYTYHPGYDFFDNHLLRNKTFKIVNPISGKDEYKKSIFNTLEDYLRDRNGKEKKTSIRLSIKDLSTQSFNHPKRLYMVDDVMKIDESINYNLYEDNGWWGFNNNATIEPNKLENRKWDELNIGRALNDRNACEFIDMYPDRTLYSFTPKYNKYRHRNEYNWNITITYPYKNLYNHPVCFGGTSYIRRKTGSDGEIIEETVSEGNRWMGLKVLTANLATGISSGNGIVFRTYTKHGLKQGELFYLYYTNPYNDYGSKFGDETLVGNETYYESETYYKVTSLGDTGRNNTEYCFYVSSVSILNELYRSYLKYTEDNTDDHKGIYDEDNNLKTELLKKILKNTNFRIRRFSNGCKSTYYIRQFRKVPNLCAAKRLMTEEEMTHKAKFNGVFDGYVLENAMDPVNTGFQREFKSENYQLGFASNIYNDNISQITFTDGVDTYGLTDNLGRPLSELYYTVVKNNAGYEKWYEEHEYDDESIEYSRCFGKVTSGLDMFSCPGDTEGNTAPFSYWKKMSSVRHMSNIMHIENNVSDDTYSNPLDNEINVRNTFFYGDLVEFSPSEFKENVLSTVMHRFNTAQRETVDNEHYSSYVYHEIVGDEQDKPEDKDKEDGFCVKEYHAAPDAKFHDYKTISRPEGYCYQAHYPILIREFTDIRQASHNTMKVRSAKPVQNGCIMIEVKTYLPHNLDPNSIVFVCNETSDMVYVSRCTGVIDKVTFLMSPDYTEYEENVSDFEDRETVVNLDYSNNRYIKRYSWLELCDILNGKHSGDVKYPKIVLRSKNTDIPDYATYYGRNTYIWRDIVNIGDSRSKEISDRVFANGYFYITQSINFFLKRQDPYGVNGLYFDGDDLYGYFPNDVAGNMQKENNFIVKDTSNITC